MKQLTFTTFALLLGASQAMAQDCTAPETPQLPDGASSTMEQMLEGQKTIKAYQAANVAFRECLDPGLQEAKLAAEKGKDGSEDAAKEYLELQEAYNASVTAEEEVAGQFNTEIREYKAANPQ